MPFATPEVANVHAIVYIPGDMKHLLINQTDPIPNRCPMDYFKIPDLGIAVVRILPGQDATTDEQLVWSNN
jgi:hypothetical protein